MTRKSMRKSQADLTEYLVFIAVMFFLIFFMVVFIFGWQFFSLGGEKAQLKEKRLDYLLDAFIESPLLNNPRYDQGLMFDDSKLMSLVLLGDDGCRMMEKSWGSGWYAEIKLLVPPDKCEGLTYYNYYYCTLNLQSMQNQPCTSAAGYPGCNVWKLCERNKQERMQYVVMPVNIYQKMNNTVALGILKIGVEA